MVKAGELKKPTKPGGLQKDNPAPTYSNGCPILEESKREPAR